MALPQNRSLVTGSDGAARHGHVARLPAAARRGDRQSRLCSGDSAETRAAIQHHSLCDCPDSWELAGKTRRCCALARLSAARGICTKSGRVLVDGSADVFRGTRLTVIRRGGCGILHHTPGSSLNSCNRRLAPRTRLRFPRSEEVSGPASKLTSLLPLRYLVVVLSTAASTLFRYGLLLGERGRQHNT